jgi:hypothetical protein
VPGDECFGQRLLFVADTLDETTVLEKEKLSDFNQELLF